MNKMITWKTKLIGMIFAICLVMSSSALAISITTERDGLKISEDYSWSDYLAQVMQGSSFSISPVTGTCEVSSINFDGNVLVYNVGEDRACNVGYYSNVRGVGGTYGEQENLAMLAGNSFGLDGATYSCKYVNRVSGVTYANPSGVKTNEGVCSVSFRRISEGIVATADLSQAGISWGGREPAYPDPSYYTTTTGSLQIIMTRTSASKCPSVPVPSAWSACTSSNGIDYEKSRTEYYCDSTTNYELHSKFVTVGGSQEGACNYNPVTPEPIVAPPIVTPPVVPLPGVAPPVTHWYDPILNIFISIWNAFLGV